MAAARPRILSSRYCCAQPVRDGGSRSARRSGPCEKASPSRRPFRYCRIRLGRNPVGFSTWLLRRTDRFVDPGRFGPETTKPLRRLSPTGAHPPSRMEACSLPRHGVKRREPLDLGDCFAIAECFHSRSTPPAPTIEPPRAHAVCGGPSYSVGWRRSVARQSRRRLDPRCRGRASYVGRAWRRSGGYDAAAIARTPGMSMRIPGPMVGVIVRVRRY